MGEFPGRWARYRVNSWKARKEKKVVKTLLPERKEPGEDFLLGKGMRFIPLIFFLLAVLNPLGSAHAYTYSLETNGCTVGNRPYNDNASFQISGSQLKTVVILDKETKSSCIICIRTTDSGGATYDEEFIITVNDINDTPTVDLDGSGGNANFTTTFNEGGGAVLVTDTDATVTDQDSGEEFASMTVTLTNRPDGNTNESLSLNSAALTVVTNQSLSSSYAASTGVLSVTGATTPANYQSVLRGVQYNNTVSTPDTTDRSITVKVNDGNTDSNTATSTMNIDRLPRVSSVNVPGNAIYNAADNLDFTVNFSETVTVDTTGGTPYIQLTIGSSTINAVYNGADDASASSHVFRYTVQAGDNDTDGIAVGGSITLNSGTIKDANGNNLNTTLNSAGSTANVKVDTTPPTVLSVAVPSNGTYKIGDNLDFTVNFSETVTVDTTGGTPYIQLTIGSSTVNAAYNGEDDSSASSHVFRYTVQAGDPDTNGIAVGDSINVNSGTIVDVGGNALTTTLNNVGSTASVNVDGVVPTVTDANTAISGASGAGGAFKVGDSVTATWNNTASGDNNSDTIIAVTVDFSAFGDGSAVSAINSSGTWTATYTIIEDGGGSIDATNRNVSVTATDNAGNSTTTADTTNATVDNDSPVVTDGNISLSGASGTNGAFKVGDTITAAWNNTAGGDNNSDITTVTVDFSTFGGGAAVFASNSSDTWTATLGITEDGGGTIEANNLNVSVTATDNAGNRTTAADTSNAILDNNSPGAATGSLAADENSANGTAVGTVSSSDAVSYSLQDNAGGRFAINSGAGAVSVANGSLLNYEGNSSHNITVRSTDNVGNTTDSVLSVTINDSNDAPTVSGSYSMGSVIESETSGGVLVSTITSGVTYADEDAGSTAAVAITATSGFGTWQYSTDNSTWVDIGTVSDGSALLLGNSSYVRFAADANVGGTRQITFRAWDTTSGSASTNDGPSKVDTASNGGTTAFSTGTAKASITALIPTSVGTSNWATAGNWNTGVQPSSTNSAIISTSNVVTVSAATTINHLAIESGGQVLVDGASVVLTINGNVTIKGTNALSFVNGGVVLLKGNILNGSGATRMINGTTNGLELSSNIEVQQ